MDWNQDGRLDILLGERDGYISYFSRLPSGELTAEPNVSCAGSTIDIGVNSGPAVVDWDTDGDLDLLVFRPSSVPTWASLVLYRNEGGGAEPVFNSCENIQTSGAPLDLVRNWGQMQDLNGDGKNDLIIGYNVWSPMGGKILFYENSGTASVPEFGEPDTLKCDGSVIIDDYHMKPYCADMNGDGNLDLIVGYKDGTLKIFYMDPTSIDQTESVAVSGTDEFYIFGSISSGEYTLSFTPLMTTDATWKIFDLTGHLVRQYDITAEAGVPSLIQFSGVSSSGSVLPNGVYVSQFTSATARRTASMVIAR